MTKGLHMRHQLLTAFFFVLAGALFAGLTLPINPGEVTIISVPSFPIPDTGAGNIGVGTGIVTDIHIGSGDTIIEWADFDLSDSLFLNFNIPFFSSNDDNPDGLLGPIPYSGSESFFVSEIQFYDELIVPPPAIEPPVEEIEYFGGDAEAPDDYDDFLYAIDFTNIPPELRELIFSLFFPDIDPIVPGIPVPDSDEVPEPASCLLLAAGCLVLRKRR